MVHLIDKDTLVAEIKRRQQTWQHQDQQYVNGGKDVCDYLLGFIDTLEVEEVDLEKEIDDYIDTKEVWEIQESPLISIENAAKHFFELGLKAQKGE